MKRPAFLSRRVVDPANSVAWFAMDWLWLADQAWPAYGAAALTLATGAGLVALDRRAGRRLNDDLALNAWMWMNALWLVSDLGRVEAARRAALGVGVLGAALLINAVRPSRRGRRTLRRFRKLRTIGR